MRDNVYIGSYGGTTVTLNDGQSHQTGSLTIARDDSGSNSGSLQNWSNGTLQISNASSLFVVQNVNVASWSNSTTGSLSLDGGSNLTVGGSFYLANNDSTTGILSVTNTSTLNVAGDFVLGHGTTSVTLDSTSQINMTGAGTLYLDNNSYGAGGNLLSNTPFTNTPTAGMFSVTPQTNLNIRSNWNNASLTLAANSSGVQFNNLALAEGINATSSGTLNVTGAVVTFNGTVNLGSHNGPQNSNDPSNAGQAVLNISNSGVVNIGGNVTAGGWGNNNTPIDA